jgi:diketogulonate reductase-like aldo/keto reductase
LVPFVVIAIAVVIGWCCQEEIPEGRFFATLIPLLKGVVPPTIVGHGKTFKGATPPVPDDLTPQPRPPREQFLVLPSGDKLPQNGLGMCCRPTAYDDACVFSSVLWYLLLGGRHIDTAHLYLNHVAIGRAIQQAIQRGIPREEIFVTTKLFPSHFGYNKTTETVPTFLDEMGLEYIDLVLMHATSRFGLPMPGCQHLSTNKDCRQETWKALSKIQQSGLVRNVGVSNFATHTLQELMDYEERDEDYYKAPIANNQIQWNPWAPQGK